MNFKFTDIQAVIGIAQFSKLDARIEQLKRIFSQYYDRLSTLKNIKILTPADKHWFPWFVDILVQNRDLVARVLDIHGIQTRITYPTLNSILKHDGHTPNSDEISNNGLFLPTHMLLTDEEIHFICNILQLIDSQFDQL